MAVSEAGPIKVLLVDDSPALLRLLSLGLSRHPDIQIVGTALDPYDAREKIKQLNPDVITLDVEMPRMNGLDFLERIMRLRPMPVVMLSSITQEGSQAAVRALSLGAVDVQVKPADGIDTQFIQSMARRLLTAARSNRFKATKRPGLKIDPEKFVPAKLDRWNGKLALVGASTGGVAAIETLLSAMPENCPPMVIAQHMPSSFLVSFVDRLNEKCPVKVFLARDGLQVLPGTVCLAPGGDVHTGVVRRGANFYCTEIRGPKRNGHYPSVDELFLSATDFADRVIAVILTGLGRDGADGMAQLHKNGARTIGQDEASSVVFGMPRAAAELGCVDRQLPLREIANETCRLAGAAEQIARA